MSQYIINIIFVGASFALYFGIAIWARAGTTSEFYVAGGGVHPVVNGCLLYTSPSPRDRG